MLVSVYSQDISTCVQEVKSRLTVELKHNIIE